MRSAMKKHGTILLVVVFVTLTQTLAGEDLINFFRVLENKDSTIIMGMGGATFLATKDVPNQIIVLDSLFMLSPPFEGVYLIHIGLCDVEKEGKYRNLFQSKAIKHADLMCYSKPGAKSEIHRLSDEKIKRLTYPSFEGTLDSISRIKDYVRVSRKKYKTTDQLDEEFKEYQSKEKNENGKAAHGKTPNKK